jgi:perosamine synthetase
MKIGKGDRVIVPSYVCTALLNAVMFTGATPVLSDVDPQCGNISSFHVKKVAKRKVRAVIAPHLFGNPLDIPEIEALGIPVIEDCAQCIGTSINGKRIGGLSTVSIYSFYATKVLAAGEGGLIATSDKAVADRIIELREYDNCDDYKPRFNFKMSDLHAAVALQQFLKMGEMISKRRIIADEYLNNLAPLDAKTGIIPDDLTKKSIFYRFVIQIETGAEKLIKFMKKKGISCSRPIYKPLHYYLNKNGFKNTDIIYNRAVSIPCYPSLTKKEIKYIINTLISFLKK